MRKLVKALLWTVAGFTGVLAVVMTVAFFWLSAPEDIPPRAPVADESGFGLDAKAGEYLLPDGGRAILTYSARGGLYLYRLDDLGFGADNYLGRFRPESAETFTWRARDGSFERRVEFQEGRGGTISFSWESDGGTAIATRDFGAPVRLGEVRFANGDLMLSGTVLLPASAGPHPGAVMIHGSGDSDRDNLWYLQIARHLAENGIAVLLPDKRGTGKSGGEWRTASFREFASDAITGFSALSALPGVDRRRVGMVGISQGGSWVAPLAASRSEAVRFVVNVSGSSVTPNEQLRHETRQTLRMQGVPAWLDRIMVPYAEAIPKRRRDTWWSLNGDFDPMPYWRELKQPVLVVYGREDERNNVPVARSLERFRALEREGITVRVFDGSGHALQEPGTRRLRDGFLQQLSAWIRRNAG